MHTYVHADRQAGISKLYYRTTDKNILLELVKTSSLLHTDPKISLLPKMLACYADYDFPFDPFFQSPLCKVKHDVVNIPNDLYSKSP